MPNENTNFFSLNISPKWHNTSCLRKKGCRIRQSSTDHKCWFYWPARYLYKNLNNLFFFKVKSRTSYITIHAGTKIMILLWEQMHQTMCLKAYQISVLQTLSTITQYPFIWLGEFFVLIFICLWFIFTNLHSIKCFHL